MLLSGDGGRIQSKDVRLLLINVDVLPNPQEGQPHGIAAQNPPSPTSTDISPAIPGDAVLFVHRDDEVRAQKLRTRWVWDHSELTQAGTSIFGAERIGTHSVFGSAISGNENVSSERAPNTGCGHTGI